MSILLLGPVELWVGERRAALGGPRQRALLALLALEPGQTVSRDRAAAELWGDSLPEGHAQRLHTVVSRLRAALREAGGPPEVVETTEIGYRLRIDPGQVDASRAVAALREVRRLRAAGRAGEASAAARDALELWRGPPLADLLDNGWAGDEQRRLEDLKLSLLEEQFDCRLELGASPVLVDELEAACAAAPLRERLHAQLMLALNVCGRRADALHAYDRVRRRLSEELGIDPGAMLREAHRTVLTTEADRRRRPVSRVRRPAVRPGRHAVLAALVVGALAATAALLSAGGGRGESGRLGVNSGALELADPDLHRVRAEIPLSGTIINEQPGGLVLADGSLWSVTEQGTVTQIDVKRRRVVGSTPLALPAGPGGMAVGLGAAWVTDSGSPTLYRLGSGVSGARRIRLPPLEGGPVRATGGVAVAAGSVWVVREVAQAVDRLAPDGRLEHRFRIAGAMQLAGDARSVWVTSGDLGVVTRLDPRTNTVRDRVRLRPVVCCLAIGGGSVWVTSVARGLLWQLRPDGAVEDVVHVPAPATELAYSDGTVWIAGHTGRTITAVDADSLDVHVMRTGQPIAGMAAGPGVVAFSTIASDRTALAGVRGPVARIVMPHNYPADLDPAVIGLYGDPDADRQRVAATCLSLYENTHGRATPYAATGPAVRTSNDRAWTFHVRPGFAFSPPSRERVDAGTFAATIERSTSPALRRSAATKALADVEGMSAYRRGLTSHLEGLQADGARLTIRLARPVSDLDARLASPYFCAVPKDTPAVATGLQGPIPSAGPYYVASGSGGGFIVLRRNPHYPRPAAGGFSAFVYRFDVEERQALELLRHGQADYVAFYGRDASARLAARLGGGDALGIRARLSPRPRATRGRRASSIAEFFGRRVGCRSYSGLYAGVELKRLCPLVGQG